MKQNCLNQYSPHCQVSIEEGVQSLVPEEDDMNGDEFDGYIDSFIFLPHKTMHCGIFY